MTVIRPNSVAGINSITAQASVISLYDVDGNLVNININNLVGVAATFTTTVVGSATTITANGINVTGVVTATSFEGSGANLTQLPASGDTNDITASLFI